MILSFLINKLINGWTLFRRTPSSFTYNNRFILVGSSHLWFSIKLHILVQKQQEIINELTDKIIPPGSNKFEEVIKSISKLLNCGDPTFYLKSESQI